MVPDRKLRLRQILDGAIQHERAGRDLFIQQACAGDAQLEREVRTLVDAFTRSGDTLDDAEESATQTIAHPSQAFDPGVVFAGRYLIQAKLGTGGMGAVYKAHDQELNRDVALKVIRRDLVASPDILHRFRMEVVLAQKIAHRNVVRIFDLGVVEGDRYFTMEYVEGDSLSAILKDKGRLDPAETASIITQVADGLAAAHTAGVIHRDLKPANIMIGAGGRVAVMDFGIARSVEGGGITRLGDIIGTPDYMAPEHARGEAVDARSDIFSLGIIFYELLVGKLPFRAVAQVGLVKRTEIPATSPSRTDPAIPAALSGIVEKCLALQPEDRYQSAAELVAELVHWQRSTGLQPPVTQVLVAPAAPRESRRWIIGAVAAAGLLGAGIVYFGVGREGGRPARPVDPVTLLIADFDNRTGDTQFDGSLEPMFALAMEDASFISSFSRVEARRLAAQVRPNADRLDRETARLVAVREGIQVVVNGGISGQRGRYVLKIEPVNATTGKVMLSRQAEAQTKNDVLKVVAQLAAPVRTALGDRTPEARQLAAETFTAGSLAAAHQYAHAQELAQLGKSEEAIQAYQETIRLDPRMGRAYSGLATVYRNIGRVDESVEQFKQALQYIDRMSERERLRTHGGYFVTVNNMAQAVEQYEQLLQKFPADSAGHANMALTYLFQRDIAKAVEEGRIAVRIYPKNVSQRNNVALYAMYAGSFEETLREAAGVLKMDPKFPKAHLAAALASLALGQRQQAIEAYGRLAATTPVGEALALIGMADLALYEGRAREAAAMLQTALAAPNGTKAPLAAKKQIVLAEALLALGKKPAALAAAKSAAAAASGEAAIRLPAALIALAAGDAAMVETAVKDLDARLTDEMSGYARILEAERLRQRGRAPDAVRKTGEALKALNLWLGQFYQGRAYLDAKAFPEAQKAFENCLTRSGEATAVFFDETPSYRYLAPVHYYAGLAAAGLGGGGRNALEKFVAIRQRADYDDPLLADARKRLAGR